MDGFPLSRSTPFDARQVIAAARHHRVAEGVQVWVAQTSTLTESQQAAMGRLLDAKERERCRRFLVDADRHAYALAHALRRCALARVLGRDVRDVHFTHVASGEPLLLPLDGPAPSVFFSHSRSRGAVAVAVSTLGPVGIDVAAIDARHADLSLLHPFIELPDEQRRREELGDDACTQFFFYWCALEAFWKARGRGLLPTNPRVRCERNGNGMFHVTLAGEPAAQSQAEVVAIASPQGCMVTLALPRHLTSPATAALEAAGPWLFRAMQALPAQGEP